MTLLRSQKGYSVQNKTKHKREREIKDYTPGMEAHAYLSACCVVFSKPSLRWLGGDTFSCYS